MMVKPSVSETLKTLGTRSVSVVRLNLGSAFDVLDLGGERRICSWKWGGTGGVAKLFMVVSATATIRSTLKGAASRVKRETFTLGGWLFVLDCKLV